MSVRVKKCADIHDCMLSHDEGVQELFLCFLPSAGASTLFRKIRVSHLSVAQYHNVMNRPQVALSLARDSKSQKENINPNSSFSSPTTPAIIS